MSPKKATTASPKGKESPAKNGNAKGSPAKNGKSKDSPAKNGKGSPSKKEVDAEEVATAMEHFAQGKRHFLVNDIKDAVESLQEACRILAEQHGETSPECGDAYFYYGKALLEMARMESDVLGNALDGVPEGEDLENSQVENPDKMSEEEKEKVSEQVDEALQETSTANAKKYGDDEATEDDDETEDDDAMDTDKKGKEDESQEDESQEDESQEDESQDEDITDEKEGEKKDEDEDVSNHQLAWEMLELAKVIYQKQEEGNKEMSLKSAQVFLKLGEVGLESETYPQSIEDFKSCLKIQEKHLEADDRCLAETHYQLGVAHSFSDEFDESIKSFTKALKIIEDRVANLKKKDSPSKDAKKGSKKTPSKDAKTSPSKDDTKEREQEPVLFEIKELNNLIPEIKEKIEDMEEMKKDAKDKINKVKKELGMASAIGGTVESSSNGFGASSNGDAKQISSSMIKKRKPEDKAEDAAKKSKAENGNTSPEKMDTDKKSDLKKKAAVDMEKKTKELKN